jgi:hypothetical protein
VENTKDLVRPQLNNLLFTFVEVLICLIESLEHLGDITHVEYVVTLCRSRQEVQLNDIEQVNGGHGHSLTQNLDLLVEDLEFEGSDSLKNPLHLRLSWNSIVNDVEL